jgi:hypothetical protein
MSRVFKAKQTKEKEERSTVPHLDSKAAANKRDIASEEGVTLVEATPVKKIKEISSAAQKEQQPGLGSSYSSQVIGDCEQDGEDIWHLPSSPDVILLGETGNLRLSSDEEVILSPKPTRKGRGKRNK